MMDYQPLELGPMQQCGSYLRRALQNEAMSPLDLLVRESIQNSLDAAVGGGKDVHVSFLFRQLKIDILGNLLGNERIQSRLLKQFPGSRRVLEIRDENTRGLGGAASLDAIRKGEPRGNLVKLVYEVGRAQNQENAGGSWGLGKTIYFRLGIGLVFYYSRYRDDAGHFRERLAACLVEDEESEARLQMESRTGIAWWGAGASGPVEEPETISAILQALDVRPYEGREVGTSVIIPCVRDDLLPTADEPIDNGDPLAGSEAKGPWWLGSYEDYLNVSIQRWYGVRLGNRKFKGGPVLRAWVNDEEVEARSMLRPFRIAQCLYNRAIGMGTEDDLLGLPGASLANEVVDIRVNTTLKTGAVVGKVAIAKLSKAQLGMAPPDNQLSPYWALFNEDEEAPYRPMVGFLRSPGMIVRWDDRSDSHGWAGGATGFADAYVLAVFVPDVEQILSDELSKRLGGEAVPLGAYLRRCEMADHRHWTDVNGFRIVQRIRSNVGRKVREFCAPKKESITSVMPLHAARVLADRLLPPGFGSDGRNGKAQVSRRQGASGLAGRKSGRRTDFDVVSVTHFSDLIHVEWVIKASGAKKHATVRLLVDSEQRPISRTEWQRDELGRFPLRIRGVQVDRVELNGGELDQATLQTELIDDGAAVLMSLSHASPESELRAEGRLVLSVDEAQRGRVWPVLSAASDGVEVS